MARSYGPISERKYFSITYAALVGGHLLTRDSQEIVKLKDEIANLRRQLTHGNALAAVNTSANNMTFTSSTQDKS